MNRNRSLMLKVWATLAGVFLLGSVTGVAVSAIYRDRVNADLRSPSIREGDAYFLLLDRELKLSPEQATTIRGILDETRNNYKAICAEVRPRYDALRAAARMRMRSLLLPKQQGRFDEIVTQENCNCPDLKDRGAQPPTGPGSK
jgi:uncharacterized membrane protein